MSLRTRLALTYTVAAAILVGVVGVAVVAALRAGLTANLDAALKARATDVSDQASVSGSPPIALEALSGFVVQVLNQRGQLLDGSDAIGDRPLVSVAELRAARTRHSSTDLTVRTVRGEHTYRALISPIGHGKFAVVAADRSVVDTPVAHAATLLSIVSVVLVFAAGVGSWVQARAAMRAVDRMREQADVLTVSAASRGLTVPASHDELSRLAITFNGLLSRLHDAFERERAFASDAGHELRTPLAVLKGELDLGSRTVRTIEELRTTVRMASRQTDHLIRLAEGLLDLVDTERPELDQFDLHQMLSDCVALCTPQAAMARVRLHLDAPSRLPAEGNESSLQRAMVNMMNNAIRYAPPGSSVDVTASYEAGRCHVAVRDRGPGFPIVFIDRAFDRLSQADPARRRRSGAGAGLGLAIVAATMKAHEGSAAAENHPGGGAKVSVSWPSPVVTRS